MTLPNERSIAEMSSKIVKDSMRKSLAADKKPNYLHWDYVCYFPKVHPDSDDIVVKVRNYQSSLEYEKTQAALIQVFEENKSGTLSSKMVLIDTGNGLEIEGGGEFYDYCRMHYLELGLQAYGVQDKWARKMKVIDLKNF